MSDVITNSLLVLINERGMADVQDLEAVQGEHNLSGDAVSELLARDGLVDVPTQLELVAEYLGTDVLDLTEMTHGNASGIGLADVITRKLFEQIDFAATYGNVITSAYLDGALIPIVMNTEREAIQLAVKTVPRVKSSEARIVRIRNTLSLREIEVSEPLLAQARTHPNMAVVSEPAAWAFDGAGVLA